MMKLLLAAAAVQLIAVASYSAFSRGKFPKRGLRRSELLLIVSALFVAVASVASIELVPLWRPRAPVAQSAAVPASQGSCATVDVGMTESEVIRRVGAPNRRLADEETRGPGAAVLLYDRSRCAVHVFNGRVELVD